MAETICQRKQREYCSSTIVPTHLWERKKMTPFFSSSSLSPCLFVFVSLILDVPLDLGKEELGTESKTPLQTSECNLNVAGMANVVVSTTRCA